MTLGMNIAKYLELKAKEKELAAEIKAVETAIKAEMEAQNSNEVSDNGFVARIVVGTQRKFDTTQFKQDHMDIYESYRHDVPTKSFQAFVEA